MNENTNSQPRLEDISLNTPVLLLVGGKGTRLRSVISCRPKPLAPLGDISFLELLVLQLRSQGLRNLVMCTGFEGEQIRKEFGDGGKWNVTIAYSEEAIPLGTAGAIKLAEPFLLQAPQFLVMNGDSFLELDVQQLIRFHTHYGGLATIAVHRVPDTARYGTVQIDAQNKITYFREKMGMSDPGLINGGVYVFQREVLKHFPDGPSGLEKDVLPALLEQGIFALEQNGIFIDIGTPDDYARAQDLYESLSRAAVSSSSDGSRQQLKH